MNICAVTRDRTTTAAGPRPSSRLRRRRQPSFSGTTRSAPAIAFAKAPATLTRKLGRYEVPVFRLGRLAVSRGAQGRGLGGDLLLAAGERALAVAQEVGGVALAIDAKDERAAAWYERFGALRLLDDPLRLVLPLDTIRATL